MQASIRNCKFYQRITAIASNLCLRRAAACHLIAVPRALYPPARGQFCARRRAERLGNEGPALKDAGKKRDTAMAAERAQNLQDTFLNHVRKSKIPLTIFLVNGVKLQGVVTWFDNFCVLLRRDGHSQLVYKHAISTIMPGHPVQLFEGAEEPPGPPEKA